MILDHFKKSPKMEPKFWAPFLKKKIAQALKKSPKWRFFAQSGHTARNKKPFEISNKSDSKYFCCSNPQSWLSWLPPTVGGKSSMLAFNWQQAPG